MSESDDSESDYWSDDSSFIFEEEWIINGSEQDKVMELFSGPRRKKDDNLTQAVPMLLLLKAGWAVKLSTCLAAIPRFLALALGCRMLVAIVVVIASMLQTSFGVAVLVPVL
ncbi:unnamed protein product [Ilex paraguariensis]|uniref:Uncharacterized protein n=1 Tax=Ilex paraguariensis TaxID=185542 RepID=A0ABC8V011_9AQUA